MTLEAAIKTYLLSISTFTALIGDRYFLNEIASEGTATPYVACHKISGGRDHDTTLSYPEYQFSCFGKTYSEAKAAAIEIIKAFKGYKGIMGGTGGKLIIQGVIMNDMDIYEPDIGLHHVPVDVKFIYWEE